MGKLIEEHKNARKIVDSLEKATENYISSAHNPVPDIEFAVRELVGLYPSHIETEDKHFFYPAQEYFTKKERNDMLKEFREFDRSLIHEKYGQVVEYREQEQ